MAEIITVTAAAGLSTIEWGGDVHVPPHEATRARAVGRETREAGLTTGAYGSYYFAGVTPAESFGAVLDTACALETGVVRIWAGRTGSHEASDESRQRITEDLRRCAELAGERGLVIATEFHADTLADTAASTLALLKAVNHPAMRTYWQPPHGMPLAQAVDSLCTLGPWLAHVHVFHWWPTLEQRHPLAQGFDRWQKFFGTLKTLPGDRSALLEFMPRDAIEELPLEAETLKKIIAASTEPKHADPE